MEHLLIRNENENNELVSNIFLGIEIFILIIWMLNIFGVFFVNFRIISVFVIGSSILLIIPIVLIRVVRINSWFMKYVLIFDMSIIVGSSYYFFSFQMIIMFVFPSLIALLYMNRRVLIFAQISTVVCLIGVHYISCFFCAQPWLNMFKDFKDVFKFEIIPRVLQLMACFFVIYIILQRVLCFYSEYDKILEESKLSNIVHDKDESIDNDLKAFEDLLKIFTDGEKNVFLELLKGKTNVMIAQALSLSNGTVKNYVSKIYDKLDCHERNYLILKYGGMLKEYNKYNL